MQPTHHSLFQSKDLRRMRWKKNRAHRGQRRNAYKMMVIERKEKIPLGIPRRRGKDDIKIGLKEIG
jgi:hypothetical protein